MRSPEIPSTIAAQSSTNKRRNFGPAKSRARVQRALEHLRVNLDNRASTGSIGVVFYVEKSLPPRFPI